MADSKILAAVCYALTWIGFLIAYLAKKDDAYVVYYGKQGLALTILAVIFQVIAMILMFVGIILATIIDPIVGMIVLIVPILWLVILILWIIGIVNALSGTKKPVPIVGKIAAMLPF